ncbi:Hypothetical protein NTJ_01011 [Nesidiocoris tenuis]|uniref:SH3 domain-containing protein n=1 Tax=Nesidiocoris tenuis TaxID=355587 RepID=A0ABN7A7R1_9HEMI|nr:Hypothetical protein NTJ_01011 [Nesidiocoris tenuis]
MGEPQIEMEPRPGVYPLPPGPDKGQIGQPPRRRRDKTCHKTTSRVYVRPLTFAHSLQPKDTIALSRSGTRGFLAVKY